MAQTRFPKLNSFAGAWDRVFAPFDAPEAQAHQSA
jgi:hypothetical protein